MDLSTLIERELEYRLQVVINGFSEFFQSFGIDVLVMDLLIPNIGNIIFIGLVVYVLSRLFGGGRRSDGSRGSTTQRPQCSTCNDTGMYRYDPTDYTPHGNLAPCHCKRGREIGRNR